MIQARTPLEPCCSGGALCIHGALTPPRKPGEQHQELSCLPAVQPKARCHRALWEHLGSELGRQNRFQEAPLVGSQRGKVARGKTHKQTSLTLRMLNIHVRHLLRVNSHLSGKPFNATLALVLCPRTSGEVHRWRHYQQVPERAFSAYACPELLPGTTSQCYPSKRFRGDWCKGN